MKEFIKHPFPPVYDKQSKVIILGSFPSVKSRENCFFYGHPQNRFWRLMAAVFNVSVPENIEDKTAFLLSHNIALWDVVANCEIEGSADSTIGKVIPNDLTNILENAEISAIFCNGKKAHELYRKYIKPNTGIEAVCLPSTSPANAAWSLKKLTETYKQALEPFLG